MRNQASSMITGIEFILRNPKNIGVSSKRSSRDVTFTNLDYKKLKLFQMSLLWRAAICSLDFYKYVDVKPEIVELLRKNLHELTPLEPHVLPCFTMFYGQSIFKSTGW